LLPKRLARLVKGSKILKFQDLPEEAKLAIIEYMPFDFVYNDENERYGYHPGIDVELLKSSIMEDEDCHIDWNTFDKYHEWYQSRGNYDHDISKPLWPVIISSDSEDTLQDGWHRFHCYIAKGVKFIPALYFVSRKGRAP
jgi:hypothetical protein